MGKFKLGLPTTTELIQSNFIQKILNNFIEILVEKITDDWITVQQKLSIQTFQQRPSIIFCVLGNELQLQHI